MKLPISKSARQYGYIIWGQKTEEGIIGLIGNSQSVKVSVNGFFLNKKNVDWKYHRISIGYKLTRALPENHNMYNLKYKNGILEVTTFHE